MMNLCTGVSAARHDAVVHEGIYCPTCEALEKLEDANQKLQQLDAVIDGFEKRQAPVNVNEL